MESLDWIKRIMGSVLWCLPVNTVKILRFHKKSIIYDC
jgi:hypothetical protein